MMNAGAFAVLDAAFGQKWSNSPLVALSLFVLAGDMAKAGVSRTLGTSRLGSTSLPLSVVFKVWCFTQCLQIGRVAAF
jgi:hypothetical protein